MRTLSVFDSSDDITSFVQGKIRVRPIFNPLTSYIFTYLFSSNGAANFQLSSGTLSSCQVQIVNILASRYLKVIYCVYYLNTQ